MLQPDARHCFGCREKNLVGSEQYSTSNTKTLDTENRRRVGSGSGRGRGRVNGYEGYNSGYSTGQNSRKELSPINPKTKQSLQKELPSIPTK